MNTLEPKITRAKELIYTSKHIALATTNRDGSPHNSPVRFFYDEKLERIYWGSNTESLHSQNIMRTGQIYAVLYDRIEFGGVYIACEGGHVLEGKELEVGLNIVNSLRVKEGEEKIALDYYTSGGTQKLWSANIAHIWINRAVRDEKGLILRDEKVELEKSDLLNTPNKLWFKAKLYGWGWAPATWQGWLTIFIYIALIFIIVSTREEYIPGNPDSGSNFLTFATPIIVLTALLIIICYKKGEKPRWQWGPHKK